MATESNLVVIGELTASADLSAKQYCYAKVSGVRTLTFAAAATDKIEGVIQNKPASGEAVALAVSGKTKVKVGAAVTAGQELMADSSGRAIPATGSGAVVFGKALETATTADQIIEALIPSVTRVIP